METSSDDDVPLASSPSKSRTNGKGKITLPPDTGGESESEAAPKARRTSNGRGSKPPPKKKVKEESDPSGADDDDKPLAPAKRAPTRKRKVKAESGTDDDTAISKKAPAKSRKKATKSEETSEVDTPKPKRGKKAKKEDSEKSPKTPKAKKEKKDDEQEEVFRWWENNPDGNGDDSIKWTTLEHNGVIFPPPYEPLPSNVKMSYNGMLNLETSLILNFMTF